jgi:hypothetical protein
MNLWRLAIQSYLVKEHSYDDQDKGRPIIAARLTVDRGRRDACVCA